MARLEDLVASVEDDRLRRALADEVGRLKARTQFGLVYERHIPETLTLAANGGLRSGDQVRLRRRPGDGVYTVQSVSNAKASLADRDGAISDRPISDLYIIRRFGDPVYPTLTWLDAVERDSDRSFHTVINGENFHALQLLQYTSLGQFDCIYLDPPYNTGKRDWKYNNNYVDATDRWRHSKWLSFMDKRLRIAKRLLASDGILVISVDENEHAHLICLIEQLFRGWEITTVTIIHNPRGIQGDNFSVTNDFAVFVTPPGAKVIAPRPLTEDDPRETRFRVWGGQSRREDGRNCFYPIYVQDSTVIGFGPIPPNDFHPDQAFRQLPDGRYEVWPLDNATVERKWRNERKTVESVVHLLRPEWAKGKLQIRIDKDTGSYRTVWTGSRYDSGSHGRRLLTSLGLAFEYPKSLYTMYDILMACTANRPDALILDYFAGSGTTLHATLLLNAGDGGRRRCVLVTNNEVGEKDARRLAREGFFAGDPQYEEHGIFEAVAVPRCEAAISGALSNGEPLSGLYEGGRLRSDGFAENCAFLRLDYLDPDDVALGERLLALLPTLWMSAGARGALPNPSFSEGFFLPAAVPLGVLLKEGALHEFCLALDARPDVTDVWIVADSERAYQDMRAALPGHLNVSMLYADYLRSDALAPGDSS
jgi:adenine-specific DNA-methyltransferase